MKILYSAFECNPLKGSDMYVGWSWANKMSELHDVHVLTSEHNHKDIQTYCEAHHVKAVFHFIDVPDWVKKIPHGYYVRYVVWNRLAYNYAKNLHKKEHFDIAHHVSIADFREPGHLWKLGGAKFVFGPVGGGQSTPKVLLCYVRNYRLAEWFRDIINDVMLSLPRYKKAIHSAAKVLVSNDETMVVMRKHVGNQNNMEQDCELGIDQSYLDARANLVHKTEDKVHILVSGRLKFRKGVAMLVDAVSRMKTNIPFVVDIYGQGEEWDNISAQMRNYNLEDKVIMHGVVKFEEMQEINKKSDIYVLPSLRETTGTSVVEAMANKLPVVALKQNGVKHLVGDDCGILVEIKDLDTILNDLAKTLDTLIENPELRVRLGENGYDKLMKEYTWDAKMKKYSDIYTKCM